MENPLQDPDFAEIVDEFCDESNELLEQLEEHLDKFEDDPTNTQPLEDFGQVIDRIMGAAKSIGAEKVGQYCELGKIVSYKSSQTDDQKLLSIVSAVLFDTVDILQSIFDNIAKSKEEKAQGINLEAFAKRLKWLSEKFDHIHRASVSIEKPSQDQKVEDDLDQASIDSLLADLGL